MSSTMADVAERAGVSKSTVSLVLNDKPSVSAELRAAVLKAAAELDYQLPRRAKRRFPRSRSIVAVHYEHHRADLLNTSILVQYVAGIQSFTQDRDVHLTFVTDYVEGEHQVGYDLLDGGHLAADGAILMGWSARRDSKLLQLLLGRDLPVVILSRNWPDLPISTVGQDHHEQACIALDHLIALGHRQIAFLGAEDDRWHEWFTWRRESYDHKMRELHGSVDPELVVVGEDCGQAARSLLARRRDVTAILCTTDPNAVAAIRALQEAGLRVPEDVSVIGLDGVIPNPEGCPRLTTVAWPHFQAGYLAAEALLKQVENRDVRYCKIVVRCELIEGETCSELRRDPA